MLIMYGGNYKPIDTRETTLVPPSIDRLQTPRTHMRGTQQPSSGKKTKFYSDIVAGREHKKFKITRSKGNHTPVTTLLTYSMVQSPS